MENYICPITKFIFHNPVLASDGFNYEFSAITKHLQISNISPMLGTKMDKTIIPNLSLKLQIKQYLEKNPQELENQYPNCSFLDNEKIIYDYINQKNYQKLLEYNDYDLSKLYTNDKLKFFKNLDIKILKHIFRNCINIINNKLEIAIAIKSLGLEKEHKYLTILKLNWLNISQKQIDDYNNDIDNIIDNNIINNNIINNDIINNNQNNMDNFQINISTNFSSIKRTIINNYKIIFLCGCIIFSLLNFPCYMISLNNYKLDYSNIYMILYTFSLSFVDKWSIHFPLCIILLTIMIICLIVFISSIINTANIWLILFNIVNILPKVKTQLGIFIFETMLLNILNIILYEYGNNSIITIDIGSVLVINSTIASISTIYYMRYILYITIFIDNQRFGFLNN